MPLLASAKVSSRLIGFALVGALLTVIVGVFGLFRIAAFAEAMDHMYAHNTVPIADVGHANIQALYHNRALYEYLAEPDKGKMDQIGARMKKHLDEMQRLIGKYKTTSLTPPELEALQRFEASWPPYIAAAGEVMKLSYEGKDAEAYALMASKGTPAFQAAGDALSKIVDVNVEIAATADHHGDEMVASSRNITMAVVLAAALLSVGLGWLVARSIVRPLGGEPAEVAAAARAIAGGDLASAIAVKSGDLDSVVAQMQKMRLSLADMVSTVRSSSEGVATASAQIAQGNNDLSARTEQQASALEETAASMEELSSTVRQNADNARQANQLATSASSVAQQGGEVVGEVVETMKGINESSRKIADIIGTIDGIAFQTNILALNAAVEAARAGEQGRGFAVVAGEVRSLAQRSAAAAKEIKDLIGASVERVEQGTALVDKAGNTMNEVVSSIKRVADIVGEITAASSEQSQGVAQVAEAVTQMDQATQQNAALVEESAAAAGSLRQQATELVQTVAVFKLEEGARARFSSASAPAASAALPVPAVGVAAQAVPKVPVKVTASAGARTPAKAPARAAASPKRAEPAAAAGAAAQRGAAAPAPALAAPPAKAMAARGSDDDWETF